MRYFETTTVTKIKVNSLFMYYVVVVEANNNDVNFQKIEGKEFYVT
jgi:hypothetical protein